MKCSFCKLRGKIVEKYGTAKSFAQALGLSATSLSLKLTGKRGFTVSDINKISSLLNISINEIGDYFFAG